jgi:tripartite-type tricarboxylate transporter receptor subunit TctC
VNRIANAACAALGLLALAAMPARAQSVADKYPEKPIRILVPFAPGGSVDVLGRLLAQRMQEHWGQTVLVENRPGAANMIATAAAAKAEPDVRGETERWGAVIRKLGLRAE